MADFLPLGESYSRPMVPMLNVQLCIYLYFVFIQTFLGMIYGRTFFFFGSCTDSICYLMTQLKNRDGMLNE